MRGLISGFFLAYLCAFISFRTLYEPKLNFKSVIMNWNVLTTEAQLTELLEKSKARPQLIYKHSTRCGTSTMIKNRLERSAIPPAIDFHFLDLIAFRTLSNKIAEDLGVRHESPQVLLIQNSECIYHQSHYAIYMEDIAAQNMRA